MDRRQLAVDLHGRWARGIRQSRTGGGECGELSTRPDAGGKRLLVNVPMSPPLMAMEPGGGLLSSQGRAFAVIGSDANYAYNGGSWFMGIIARWWSIRMAP